MAGIMASARQDARISPSFSFCWQDVSGGNECKREGAMKAAKTNLPFAALFALLRAFAFALISVATLSEYAACAAP
jgi:hypothetical protein